MNRSVIVLADSDASDQEAALANATAAAANSDEDSASSPNDSDTEYSIDLVDDPADEDDDATAAANNADDSCIDLPDTPLQKRADELVNRYLRRATQPATPVAAARPSNVHLLEAPPVDSSASSDSGQATIGTTPAKSSKSVTTDEPMSQGSNGATQANLPLRRSVRLKSVTDDAHSLQSSRKSSYTTPLSADEVTIDEVCVSSSSQDSSQRRQQRPLTRRPSTLATHSDQNSSSTTASGRAAPAEHLQRRLQARVQRLTIDQHMATLSVSSESTNAATAAASANESTPRRARRQRSTCSDSTPGPSPRKQRARTPSAKCLESFNLEDLQLSTPRRTARTRTPCKRYDESLTTANGKRSARKSHKWRDEEHSMEEEEEDDDGNSHAASALTVGPGGKSTMLYDQEADVAGQQIFAFRTPKKRNGMAKLVAGLAPSTPQTPKERRQTVEAPQTPKTPRNGAAAKAMATKTPSRVRSVLKRELAKFNMPDTSGTDFSADESDEYKPNASDSDEDEKSASSDDSDDSAAAPPKAVQKKRYVPPAVMPTPSARSTRLASRRQQDFVPECEDYFTHHTNKKAITSDRTLDRMKTPRLPQGDLFKLLAATSLSAVHEQAVADMHREHQQHFAKWRFVMSAGFNILLHGLGSKRSLLQQFHQDVLADQTVLVVNGFFPSLTIKDVLDSIAVDILELTALSRNQHEIVDAIAEELAGNPEQHLFLIVHNIDGVMLRNHKAQLILSRLAKVEQIHMIASMDHINAPLLWDHIKLSNFNFSWWDTTTMLPYTEETAFENSMLVNSSGGLALSSMKNVFLSLTQNSRGIFLIIVRNQLENKGNANFQGMPFKELYSRCRENFLVSSDVALRSQLTEFIDHHLVKMRRTSDGIENLVIPLDGALLQQFLELQENND